MAPPLFDAHTIKPRNYFDMYEIELGSNVLPVSYISTAISCDDDQKPRSTHPQAKGRTSHINAKIFQTSPAGSDSLRNSSRIDR
ncbi:hypothetical protein [Sporisorium scitamineum]|uniref:Uncharacterized protein n=1 Tax=Sporisorium scitamineum TaxID=49012 RepID=A0A0F7RVV3_9BASI|nr:hypothetical protein [Sporisorium scitamineum]